MAPHRPSARLAAPSFLLAIALVVGSAAPTIARDAVSGPDGPFGGSAIRSVRAVAPTGAAMPDATARAAWRQAERTPTIDQAVQPTAEVRPPVAVPVARPETIDKSSPATGGGQSTASFKGRNHVWIPTLGIDRSVAGFACSSKAYPGNRVYRWGCAGRNNVYLFGHAHSDFKPLHDAYVSGRLRKGLAVFYAAGDGVVHRYVVRWWKVTTPDKGAWAFAAQSRPSLTLQTCVGARSQYRLVVRLVRAG